MEIAYRLTGMDQRELREFDFNKGDGICTEIIPDYYNRRPGETLEDARLRLKRDVPKCLKR